MQLLAGRGRGAGEGRGSCGEEEILPAISHVLTSCAHIYYYSPQIFIELTCRRVDATFTNMPRQHGPKMGPRPDDFNEALVRQAPTFKKWEKLSPGETLTYASRKFTKGKAEDEERLMRRIMIARRNNVKDHAVLKRVRAAEAEKRGVIPYGGKSDKHRRTSSDDGHAEEQFPVGDPILDGVPLLRPASPSNPSGTKRRRHAGALHPTDEEILMEMDVPAVEATRSYRKWASLPDGAPFTYNQSYIKGQEEHDWLLRKNIWRRMRYRRENQKKVEELKDEYGDDARDIGWAFPPLDDAPVKLGNVAASKTENDALVSRAVVDAAAVAAVAASSFDPGIDADAVAALGANDPIVTSALDAAAQLAAAALPADLEEAVLAEPVVNDPSDELADADVESLIQVSV